MRPHLLPTRLSSPIFVLFVGALALAWHLGSGDSKRYAHVQYGPLDFSAMTGEVPLLIDIDERLRPEERAAFVATLPRNTRLNSVHSDASALYRVVLPVQEAAALAERLERDPRVRTVEVDVQMALFADPRWQTPNDPLYPTQWNFEQIAVADAWNHARGDGVVVAVIDTGVAYADDRSGRFRQVRDLAGTRFVAGYDFVDDNDQPYDEHGHGTHVAGTIAQTTNNGYGVAGVAPNAAIMPLRVLDANGYGNVGDIADAIRFAADNGAHVINLSLGGPIPSRVMSDAVDYARRKGVVVVAAAGNSGWSLPSFPAAYRGVIAVSATQYDEHTTFYSNYGSYIDIAAPGGNTQLDQNGDGQPDGILQETLVPGVPAEHEFALYMGTSMAAPHVAGVAALVRSTGVTHPNAIEEILLSTARNDIASYDESKYGSGIVHAGQAVRASTLRYESPRALIAIMLSLLGISLASRRQKLRPVRHGWLVATAVAIATGAAIPLFVLSLFGASVACLAPFTTSVLFWPAQIIGQSLGHSVLVVSVMPVIAVYAAFGGFRSKLALSIVLGAMLGITAALIGEALAPLHDVTWMPGVGLLDRLWLIVNAVVATIATFLAMRRS